MGDWRNHLVKLLMDNIGGWNVRGINGLNKQMDVKKFLHQNNIGLYGLVETKVKSPDFATILNNIGSHWKDINNNQYHHGERVWIIWISQFFYLTILHMSAQSITVRVLEKASGDEFIFTVVYGFNDNGDRTELSNDLKLVKNSFPGAWGICGDFNNVLNYNERIGRDVTWSEIADFRECIQYCGVTDIKGQSAFSRGTISMMLVVDHTLELIDSLRAIRNQPKGHFKYYNMWGLDPEFKEIVQTSWNVPAYGTPMFKLVSKLKRLKHPLKDLNRNKFSDIEKAVGVAKSLLKDIQIQLTDKPTNLNLITAECEASDALRHLSKIQHSFLSQRAKTDWIKYGDENTIFFHNHIRARQIHNRLLGTSHSTSPVHIPTVSTGKLITDHHKTLLLSSVSAAEIKGAFFSIPSSKSPGPDGYSSQFFKDSWDIVGENIISAAHDFFHSGRLLKQVNNTTITLIPKVDNPTSVLEFRPIACCNMVYKCIAKILCNRLSKVLPDIINEIEGGFVNGRNIVENVLICQDIVRLYNRKAASPRCLIKIDLRKAYDSVEWTFLDQILDAMGFPKKFIGLIMKCVQTPSYTLSVNGSSFDFFEGKRGLRKGDPLSPLLFTIYMEYLSRILGIIAQQDDFRYHPMCGHIKLNHLLFADDLLMFCKGTETSIMWILRSFATFSATSGLQLNKSKSEIYFNGVSTNNVANILQVSGFQRGTLPFKYLGVPISSQKLTKNEGMKLLDKMVARIRGWGTRHLSYAGRLTLCHL
ncbi:uncharacterized protein LOC141617914 [Silene latifolia]|uniref:uncharacterized protein LOC141617914 n=1 Tax=Silene latifolia TaxID=37657 RepID=UPI003D77BF59